MPELHAFIDRDVMGKLTCCDLWDTTMEAYGITHTYRLFSAKAQTCIQDLTKSGVPDDLLLATARRLEVICERMEILPVDWLRADKALEVRNAVFSVRNIDQGEAELMSVTLTAPVENVMVTGDRRFCDRLKTHQPALYAQLKPKLILFEHCLLRCADHIGFEEVRRRAVPAILCDTVLRNALGSGMASTEANFRDALASYGGTPTCLPEALLAPG